MSKDEQGSLKMPLWLGKLIVGWAFIIGHGALGGAIWDHYKVGDLVAKYETLKAEGTDLCKAHKLGNVGLRSDFRHAQETQDEIKEHMKSIDERLQKQTISVEKILTAVEAMKGDGG